MFMMKESLLHKVKTYQNARDDNSYLLIYKVFHDNKYFNHYHLLYCYFMNFFYSIMGIYGQNMILKKQIAEQK